MSKRLNHKQRQQLDFARFKAATNRLIARKSAALDSAAFSQTINPMPAILINTFGAVARFPRDDGTFKNVVISV